MGGLYFEAGNADTIFPVLRLDDGQVRVGPFRADPDSGLVIADPWPLWIQDMFPHPSVIAEYPEWRSFGYSAWKGGGVWAVLRYPIRKEGMTGPEISVFFISRNGDLLRTVHISNPGRSVPGLLRVYDNWVFAFGDLIHENGIVRPEVLYQEPFKWEIHNNTFCLGPDGVLVFYNGHLVYPDGRITHIFRSDWVARQVCGNSPYLDRVNTDGLIVPLGFDGKTIWLLVEDINIPEDDRKSLRKDAGFFAIVRMELNKTHPSSIEVVRRLKNVQLSGLFHFMDGGWLVSVREFFDDCEKSGYGERWFFKLPGSECMEEISVFAGDDYNMLFGEMFFPDGENGLLGIVEVEKEADPSSTKVFLVEWRKGEVKMIELLPMSLFNMHRILDVPWLIVEGNGKEYVLFTKKRLVLFTKTVSRPQLPGMSISPEDLEIAIRKGARIENPDEAVVLEGMIHHRGTIITHGYIGTEVFPFIASLQLSGDELRLISFNKIPYRIDSYTHIRKNDSDFFYLKSTNFSKVQPLVFVLLEKNVGFPIFMTA